MDAKAFIHLKLALLKAVDGQVTDHKHICRPGDTRENIFSKMVPTHYKGPIEGALTDWYAVETKVYNDLQLVFVMQYQMEDEDQYHLTGFEIAYVERNALQKQKLRTFCYAGYNYTGSTYGDHVVKDDKGYTLMCQMHNSIIDLDAWVWISRMVWLLFVEFSRHCNKDGEGSVAYKPLLDMVRAPFFEQLPNVRLPDPTNEENYVRFHIARYGGDEINARANLLRSRKKTEYPNASEQYKAFTGQDDYFTDED